MPRFVAVLLLAMIVGGCASVEGPTELPRVWRDDATESIYVELDADGVAQVVGFPAPASAADCARRTAATVTAAISWEAAARGEVHLFGNGIDANLVAGERFGVVWSELQVNYCGGFEQGTWTVPFYETGSLPADLSVP